jgi:hypothetical protein
MAKCIFPEQELTFFEDAGDWVTGGSSPFTIEEGKTYEVYWDGVKYIITAIGLDIDGDGVNDTGVIGQVIFFDPTLPANDCPFVVMTVLREDGLMYMMMGEQGIETHTVAIYVQEEVGIILKDRNGDDTVYEGIAKIRLATTDGGTQIFSKGETEETAVALNFEKGDMTVTPDDGKLFSAVNIPKPENLISENIAEHITIAGVTGTYKGSGGDGDLVLEEWSNSYITQIPAQVYQGITSISKMVFTKATSITNNSFYGCVNLAVLDFHALSEITLPPFNKCVSLSTLIIRTETMCAQLSNVNTLFGVKISTSMDYRTPIAKGTGYIYVPAALVETYKADSGWSQYAAQFRAIEDYPEICG